DQSKHDEFARHLAAMFKTRTRDEWFEELRDIELCVAPVLDLDEALADPHQRERGMVVELDDPELGRVSQVGIGPKFSETPGAVRTTAPRPGQHTREVLAALGYDSDRVEDLVAR